jgi:hypothetical protein
MARNWFNTRCILEQYYGQAKKNIEGVGGGGGEEETSRILVHDTNIEW